MACDAKPVDAASVRYLVTLVHGTFATNAPWLGKDSTLSTALRNRLGDGLKLVPFKWSGNNSPRARRQDSARLARQLACQVGCYSGAQHYLVGHSHGGNVALSAAVTSGVLDKIAGIVCLATPFLVARERDLGRYRRETFVGIILVIAFGGPAVLDLLLAPMPWSDGLRWAVKAFLLLVPLVGVMLLMIRWQERAQRLLRDLAFPAVDPRKVLIVRSPADEASGFLVLGQFVSQLTVRVFLAAQRLLGRIQATATRWAGHRWALAGVAAAACLAAAGSLIAYAEASRPGTPTWIPQAALVAFYGAMIVVIEAIVLAVPWFGIDGATAPFRLGVSVLTWPTVFVLSLFLLPFGVEVAMANILLEVTAEAAPPGSWMVHMFEPPTSTEMGTDTVPLMHSVVYENPRVLAFVSDWIARGPG